MYTAEGLGNVAIPTDRLPARENFRQFLRAEVLPLAGLEIRAEQGGSMIEMVQWPDRFMAKHALFPFIPLGDDTPHETIFGICLNLLQAILAATGALGPAGTFVQAQGRLGEKRAKGGFTHRDFDRSRFLRFRTCNQALAAILKESADPGNGAENEESYRHCKNDENDKHGE